MHFMCTYSSRLHVPTGEGFSAVTIVVRHCSLISLSPTRDLFGKRIGIVNRRPSPRRLNTSFADTSIRIEEGRSLDRRRVIFSPSPAVVSQSVLAIDFVILRKKFRKKEK